MTETFPDLTLHHVGFSVADLDLAIAFYGRISACRWKAAPKLRPSTHIWLSCEVAIFGSKFSKRQGRADGARHPRIAGR